MEHIKKMGRALVLLFAVAIAESPASYGGNRIAKKPGVVLTSSSAYNGGLLQQVSSPQLAGYLDKTFNARGYIEFVQFPGAGNSYCVAVAQQQDGKYVLAGWASIAGQNYVAVARLTTFGQLDTSFGIDGTGMVVLDHPGASTGDLIFSVTMQSDGKIILGGTASVGGRSQGLVVRLTTNGTPDLTFGTLNNGMVILPPSQAPCNDTVQGIQIQQDGKIVVVGYSHDFGTGSIKFLAWRLNTDGSEDTTFGTLGTGAVLVDTFGIGNDDKCFCLAIQPDGKIILAGSSANANTYYAAARLNQDGSMDLSFGNTNTGTIIVDDPAAGFFRQFAVSVQLQTDGKIVMAGTSDQNGPPASYSAVRLLANGLVDTSFGPNANGIVVLPDNIGGNNNDVCYGMQLQADGKIVMGGLSSSVLFGIICYSAARLLTDGSLDLSFGPSGTGSVVLSDFGGGVNNECRAMLITRLAEIVLAGFSHDGNDIWSAARITNQYTLPYYQAEYPTQGGFY